MSITKSNAKDGTYAGKYSYQLSYAGSEGYTGTGRILAVTDYSKTADGTATNALSMWVKPDGNGQKLVVQLVSDGYEFEAYLTDFMTETQAQYVTIPFSAMKPKVSGKVFNPANVTQMYFYCNTVPENAPVEDKTNYTLDSEIYFDKIMAIAAEETALEDVGTKGYIVSDRMLDGSVEENQTTEDITTEDGTTTEAEATTEDKTTTETEVTTEDKTTTETEVTTEDKTTTETEVTTEGKTTTETEVTTEDKTTTEIEVTTEDKTTTEEIPNESLVTSVSMNKTTLSLFVGTTERLTATVLPENAENKALTWTSTNETVATVDAEGVVTAKAEGVAVIKAETNNSKYALCVVQVSEETEETVSVDKVILNTEKISLNIGVSGQLTATILPMNATNAEVVWSTSDASIATVDDNGKVTAKAAGETVITATSADGGKTASCLVEVKKAASTDIAVEDVILSQKTLTLKAGESLKLVATVLPTDATNKMVTWKSNDPTVATVEDGIVTAVAEGVTTITVTTADGGFTAVCAVEVQKEGTEKVAVSSVSIVPNSVTLTVGDTIILEEIVLPSDADNKEVIWKSSQDTVAFVDTAGVVTAKAVGEAMITVTTVDGGKTATCKVTVKEKEAETVSVTGVNLNIGSMEMKPGDETPLIATILPADATNQNVVWSTSNGSVATVSEKGIVTALAEGTTTITVTTEDGLKKATCEITVIGEKGNDVVSVDRVLLSDNELALKPGEKKTLIATIIPATATNQEVTWLSSSEEVATVKDGVVTAVSEGTTVIVVTTADGGKIATCTIEVSLDQPAEIEVVSVTVNPESMTLTVGEQKQATAVISPENATNSAIEWVTADASVARVSADGMVTAVGAGSTTIIAKASNGKFAMCNITVKEKQIVSTEKKVTGIKVSTASTITLVLKKAKALNAQVVPADADNKTLTYASSNEKVATVTTDGVVRAVAPGVADITIKAANNVQIKVQVKVAPAKVTKLKKTSVKATSAKLVWKKQSGVTGYKIYKYNTKTKKYKLYKTIKKNTNYITVKKLKKNTTYKFKVRAYKKSGNTVIYSSYSKVLKVKTKK